MAKQLAKDKHTRIAETRNRETATKIKSHSPITDASPEQHITSLTAELALESPRISERSYPARRVSIIAANGSRRRSVESTASINSAVEESSASEDCFAVEEFSSRPWVQEALNNPWHPNSVLSFFTVSILHIYGCSKHFLNSPAERIVSHLTILFFFFFSQSTFIALCLIIVTIPLPIGHQLRRSEMLQRIAATCQGFRKDEHGYETRR